MPDPSSTESLFEGCDRSTSTATRKGWTSWIYLLVASYFLCGYLLAHHGSPAVLTASLVMTAAWLITGISVAVKSVIANHQIAPAAIEAAAAIHAETSPFTESLAVVTGTLRTVTAMQVQVPSSSGRLAA